MVMMGDRGHGLGDQAGHPGTAADRTVRRRGVPAITIETSIHQLRSVCAARTCSIGQSSARLPSSPLICCTCCGNLTTRSNDGHVSASLRSCTSSDFLTLLSRRL